ncbi:MAG: hypothetical protein DI535_01255 [Citrobacter freundii]|nr:MAG: hypothetical protein DI535_01255 [Citrobacter freundii]
MHRLSILFLLFQFSLQIVSAQTTASDTLRPSPDSLKPAAATRRVTVQQDTIVRPSVAPVADTMVAVSSVPPAVSVAERPLLRIPAWEVNPAIPFSVQVMYEHPFFNFKVRPFIVPSNIKVFKGKETFFYVIAGLVLAFALLKLAFSKYFNDLFRVFFRTTMKQRQIREQLMQTPVPSLGFNLFFVASAGLYVDFLLFHYGFKPVDNFWVLYFYCCLALTGIYAGKFVALKFCGWMFNVRQAADSYIFIVFIINKVIGIFLLPFLALLAFSDEPVRSIALTVSWCGIGLLFLYRFILGFGAVRNEVRFNLFHFLLYIVAFEVAPLLLIYRLLLFFFK